MPGFIPTSGMCMPVMITGHDKRSNFTREIVVRSLFSIISLIYLCIRTVDATSMTKR